MRVEGNHKVWECKKKLHHGKVVNLKASSNMSCSIERY